MQTVAVQGRRWIVWLVAGLVAGLVVVPASSLGQTAPIGLGMLVACALAVAALVRQASAVGLEVGPLVVVAGARVRAVPVTARQCDPDAAGRARPRAPGGRVRRAACSPR